jgi:hypothetical protein
LYIVKIKLNVKKKPFSWTSKCHSSKQYCFEI